MRGKMLVELLELLSPQGTFLKGKPPKKKIFAFNWAFSVCAYAPENWDPAESSLMCLLKAFQTNQEQRFYFLKVFKNKRESKKISSENKFMLDLNNSDVLFPAPLIIVSQQEKETGYRSVSAECSVGWLQVYRNTKYSPFS